MGRGRCLSGSLRRSQAWPGRASAGQRPGAGWEGVWIAGPATWCPFSIVTRSCTDAGQRPVGTRFFGDYGRGEPGAFCSKPITRAIGACPVAG